jgi:hypothetical protein
MFRLLTILAVVLTGCAPLPPTPQDLAAKRFVVGPDIAVV